MYTGSWWFSQIRFFISIQFLKCYLTRKSSLTGSILRAVKPSLQETNFSFEK